MESIKTSVVKRILIVVAMTHEALPLVAALGLKPLAAEYHLAQPMVGYRGEYDNGEVLLIINGPRPVNNPDGSKRLNKEGQLVTVEGVSPVSAALATWEGVRIFKPHLILNVGTVGGLKSKGAVKGTVYISGTPIKYHDRLINFRLPGDEFEPNNYQAFGIGSYMPVACPKLSQTFSLPPGSISTGSSFDQSQGNVADQFEKNNAFLKEMEAAAIAEVAELANVPFLALKGVTDYIDAASHQEMHEDFGKELVPVSEKISQSTVKIVHWVLGKALTDL